MSVDLSRSGDPAADASLELFKELLGDFRPRDFSVRFWNGLGWDAEGGGAGRFTLVFRHPGSLRKMLWPPNELSFAEAFIHGSVDVEGDIEGIFDMADHLARSGPRAVERVRFARRLLSLPGHGSPAAGRRPARLRGPLHSLKRDREAIAYHYDVSNAFYSLWLDSRMIYSCAYFTAPGNDLETAQRDKLDCICRKLRLQAGERLLDIGCGWGGLVIHAARHYGVKAHGITLSRAQAEFADGRIRREGMAGVCRVELRDYREIEAPGAYDKMVSVGMFEHVGKSRLPEYFSRAFSMLRPGGLFLNHGIAESGTRPKHRGPSFADRYVFPDGELVPLNITLRAAEESGFEVRDIESLREHYALTLRHWVRRLEARRKEAVLASDDVTCRVWHLYMAGAAHMFRSGETNVYQALLAKTDRGESGLPLTRADWYR